MHPRGERFLQRLTLTLIKRDPYFGSLSMRSAEQRWAAQVAACSGRNRSGTKSSSGDASFSSSTAGTAG
jgi:hypothetical protein